jgi:hypothetical protein
MAKRIGRGKQASHRVPRMIELGCAERDLVGIGYAERRV